MLYVPEDHYIFWGWELICVDPGEEQPTIFTFGHETPLTESTNLIPYTSSPHGRMTHVVGIDPHFLQPHRA